MPHLENAQENQPQPKFVASTSNAEAKGQSQDVKNSRGTATSSDIGVVFEFSPLLNQARRC